MKETRPTGPDSGPDSSPEAGQSASPAKRARPRSASRADGALTRNRILEAAGPLFALHGYAETTNKAIAAAAGVDLASINYHFGGRDGLYQSVLAAAHQRFIKLDELTRLAALDLPPAEKLRMLLSGLVAKAADGQGWHVRVLARELLSPSSHVQILFEEEVSPKLRVLMGILAALTGIPENAPALQRCLLNVAAPCLMLLVLGHNVPGPMQGVRHTPPGELVEHLFSYAMGGLEAISRSHHAQTQTPAA